MDKNQKIGVKSIKTLYGCLFFLLLLVSIQKVDAASLTCKDVNDPKKIQGKIITVLEEEISSGGPGAAGEEIITCVRETIRDAQNNEMSEYTSPGKCTPTSDGETRCKRVQVYIAGSGTELLYRYVGSIYRWAAGTVGIVCVLLLVLGGIEIASAGGDTGRMDKAKARITQSLGGLVLLFLSALILYTINPNFFTK